MTAPTPGFSDEIELLTFYSFRDESYIGTFMCDEETEDFMREQMYAQMMGWA